MTQVPDLATDYYLHNFLQLLTFVTERYWPLLPEPAQHFQRRFMTATKAAQQLYIRLLTRKGEFFLLRKLRYHEIGDLSRAARQLEQVGLCLIDPQPTLDQLLALYTKAELADRLGALEPALRRHQSRSTWEATLLGGDAARQAMIADRLLAGETLLQPLDADSFTSFQLCFFGNLRQNLTDFVLRDLGLQRYENYPLDAANAPFQTRRQLEQHLHYYALLAALDDEQPLDIESLVTLWRQLPSPAPQDRTLQRRVRRTINKLARQLERLGASEQALLLYQSSERPPARERMARILVQRGDLDSGLGLCRAMLAAPRIEEERVFAEEFGARHARKHGIDWPEPTRYAPPVEQIALVEDGSHVERAAAAHYAANGACFYVENSLFNGMLGLCIWDILFAPIRGAFFNPFQSAPADYREPSFVTRRQALFDQRLAELQDERAMKRRIHQTWEQKHGLQNPLVHWERLDLELLELALARIPNAHWLSLFQRLLGDLAEHRSGLPDLILFPDRGGYQLIEVKGPGDRLQKNQRRWMQFFARCAIPHQVSQVSWLAS